MFGGNDDNYSIRSAKNDEVMVCLHMVELPGINGEVMAFARIRDNKLAYWAVVRAIILD